MGSGFSDPLYPWHADDQPVAHRLVVGCAQVPLETRTRWAKALESWVGLCGVQMLWVYDLEDATLVRAWSLPRLLVRDASLVMPTADWMQWKGRSFPIPLIKDLFQLRCLHMFGGWWVDMDYFMVRPSFRTGEAHTGWLLATEYEQKGGTYEKGSAKTIVVGKLKVCVNMGMMWAKQGLDTLKEAESKARALWQGKKIDWTGGRKHKSYCKHQLMIQELFARQQRADIMDPKVTSPFPRWLQGVEDFHQQKGRVLFGVRLPTARWVATEGFACNSWDGCWKSQQSDALVCWVVEVTQRSHAPDSVASPVIPTQKQADAAHIILHMLPGLVQCGAPVAIALRAMAAALDAVGRNQMKCTFAKEWAPKMLAFGFLSGALKQSWVRTDEEATVCVANLSATLTALRELVGLTGAGESCSTTAFDCVFLDLDVPEY